MWNLSKRGRQFRGADVIFVSVPKCGRTWVRAFVHAYFSSRAGIDLSWDVHALAATGAPRVLFTHDRWEQRATPHLWKRLRGADMIPIDRRRRGRIGLLVRDPRDVVVSLFFQLTRRENWHRGDLASMIRHPRFGIDSLVHAMNAWLREWSDRGEFSVTRYEDLRGEGGAEFRRLLEFLGEPSVDEDAFASALSFSEFDHMRKLERTGGFEHGTLQPGDPGDPDSYKMRRGQVGAYRDYLGEEELACVESGMRRLDPRLGYGMRDPIGR